MLRRVPIVLFAFAVLASTGCVERRFRVESNPPGAYVSINNVPYGPTPVDIPFLYYGNYEIELKKEGYQTLRVNEPVTTPWYEWPVIDFFSEGVWPRQITDIRPLRYDLEPAILPNLDLLKAEAEKLRKRGHALPPPRYPEIDKKEKKDKKDKKQNPDGTPPKKNSPNELPVPPEALPVPRELPGLPESKSGEPKP